jgi:hypothetical protein
MELPATLRGQGEKFLHFIVMGDEIWVNDAATKKTHDVETSIISTSKEIRSTAIRNEDQITCLLGPRRRDSCRFPWPH